VREIRESSLHPLIICLGMLNIALQGRNYVSYSHLDVSVVDGRGKSVWLVAVICQILIKTFIGSGYDRLEQPLQTAALQLLNRPTCCLKFGEVFFDSKRHLQHKLLRLESWLSCFGLGYLGSRRGSLASRHADSLLRNFVKNLVGTPKNKGFKTLLKSNPTPCKNQENQHRKQKTQSIAMDCAFILSKMGTK
jgi:hypothetical protein